MKKTLILLFATLAALTAAAQELPQFNSSSFEGWTYNNPGVALTSSNIAGGKIVLYVNSQRKALTLCSPEFSCQDIDTIAVLVTWETSTFYVSDFDLSRTALTIAIEDTTGTPLDSVTCTPMVLDRTHTLSLRLAVPAGLTDCRLRFVSWSGTVVSSGAVKRADITAVASTTPADVLLGDVDNDGHVSISDVTELIDCLLFGMPYNVSLDVADIDHDGKISITDVTALIDLIANGITDS